MGASYQFFENFTAGLSNLAESFSSTGWGVYGQLVGGVYRITIPAGVSITSGHFHLIVGRGNLITNGTQTYSGEILWRRTAGVQSYRIGFLNPSGGDFVGAVGSRAVFSSSVSEYQKIEFSGGVPSNSFQDRLCLQSQFTGTSTESVFEIDYAKLWIGTEPAVSMGGFPLSRLVN
jgi:hypothetical protein